MNKYKVFIDGAEGTTGLEINKKLELIPEIELIKIDDSLRKDEASRKECINSSDLTILCLPDVAAIHAMTLIENDTTKIIDASTAHRVDKNFVYGFPELSKHQEKEIINARYVANPGCHATGFISLAYPLLENDILPHSYPLSAFSITGYSGGGKSMIKSYEELPLSDDMKSPRLYSLSLNHKHIPEIMNICSLTNPPIFTPIVGDYYKGMTTSIPIANRLLLRKMSARDICDFYKEKYKNSSNIIVSDFMGDIKTGNGYLPATLQNDTNNIEIFVFGNDENTLVTAVFDNLGKGASGACVQNLKLMLNI
ncbi:MAG: N-acetyl-gamma-glutamyl-phosphate reductase [Clostridia bacterium]